MNKNLRYLGIVFFAITIHLNAQTIERVEPLHWWAGMENTALQLLIYGENISELTPDIESGACTITKIHKAKSPNYLFIDLDIAKAKPGTIKIDFKQEGKSKLSYNYQLKERKKKSTDVEGFSSADAIFLITPDRFANGNPENDQIVGLLDQEVDRTNNYKRHGGDIEGIIRHLNYIEDLGYTAIWSTPLLTNNMETYSYHGYGVTNLYEIDPRFGTLDDYKKLSDEASKKGIKLIMDQIANHCGLGHWWMEDLPFSDWVNYQEHFETNRAEWSKDTHIKTNHRRTTNQDKYASNKDKQEMNDGWFVYRMPDLNQRNPFMATYIIQNSIWWIEEAGLSGIRQDTYPYPDKSFMSNWAGAIMNEYPNFSIVGEEWSLNPLIIGYWQDGQKNTDGYSSNLTSIMDFPMQKSVVDGLKEVESRRTGLIKIYEGLANDFGYVHPQKIMIFPDNHDKSRIFTQFNQDLTMTKMALGYYAMMPRIFQGYYGTEILMHDTEKPGDHGLIRSDFPGGWQEDQVNAFTGEGLTASQKEMQVFVTKLLNYRKNSKAIHEGATIHFAPTNGVYILFRTLDDETVVIILNKNEQPLTIDLNRFIEIGLKGKSLENIISDSEFVWGDSLSLKEKGVFILTTKIK